MFDDPEGPIEHYEFAKFVICGAEHSSDPGGGIKGCGADIRLVEREVTSWRERRGHVMTSAMLSGLEGLNLEVLVIGLGANGMLRCPDEVKSAAEDRGWSVVAQPTPEACRTYNDLCRRGRRAALLAHGTC